MRYLFSMAWHSAWNRRFTLGLTLLSIALSVTLLLGVERIRHDARQAFAQSVSGTDLVIGARTSPVQLMLYSVFHIGEATNNIHWQAYQEIAANPTVAWSIPISLGDSHRGFPVLGTHAGYFEHFHYGNRQSLTFETGKPFDGVFDTVIGSEVAASLGYHPGDHIVLTHGAGGLTGQDHNDKPFVVTGILAPTGTPVDRTVHVSLEAIEAIHLDWQGGARMPGFEIPAEYVRKFDLTPKSVTAILIGLKSRAGVFRMQRLVNDYADEPLLAVLPGVALDQLWQVVGAAEHAFLAVSAMVVVVGLCGLVAVILASLNERRRELAIIRSVGARPADIFVLLTAEGVFITLSGILLGIALLYGISAAMAPLIQGHFGIAITPRPVSLDELWLIAAIIGVSLLASLVPGYGAYRMSLADGLTPRI